MRELGLDAPEFSPMGVAVPLSFPFVGEGIDDLGADKLERDISGCPKSHILPEDDVLCSSSHMIKPDKISTMNFS